MKLLSVALLFCLLISCNEFYRKNPPEEKEKMVCGNSYPGYSSNGYDGKALFSSNCASCHNPLKDATGPALRGMSRERDIDWLYKFLTDKKFTAQDDRSKVLRKQYGLSYQKFPTLNKEQVESIFGYIGS